MIEAMIKLWCDRFSYFFKIRYWTKRQMHPWRWH